jgi:hypothetical protein
MQRLNFGRIEDLVVRGGEPVFDPAPRVIQQMIELVEAIASLGEGKVLTIDVKHGLPFAVEIEFAASTDKARRVA